MGRRKWKLYQEVLARSHLNANHNTITNAAAVTNVTSNATNSINTTTTVDPTLNSAPEATRDDTVNSSNCPKAHHKQSDVSESGSRPVIANSLTATDDCNLNKTLHHCGAAMPGANCSNGSSSPPTPLAITTAAAANNRNHQDQQAQPPRNDSTPVVVDPSLSIATDAQRRRSSSPKAENHSAADATNDTNAETPDSSASDDGINKFTSLVSDGTTLPVVISTESLTTEPNKEAASSLSPRSVSTKVDIADSIKRKLSDTEAGRIDDAIVNDFEREKANNTAEVDTGE